MLQVQIEPMVRYRVIIEVWQEKDRAENPGQNSQGLVFLYG